MADTRNYVQGQDYFLAGSGVSATDTTVVLTSFKYPNSGTNIVTADFGTLGYITFEPETSREENISFTTVTQNADGTATLTGVTRGLEFKTPYTQNVALRTAHAGGAKARVTNSAPFYNEFANKKNDETIQETWTYTDPNVPRMDVQPAYGAGTELYFATKDYVDGVAIAGAPNASTTQKGIVQEGTQAQVDARTTAGSTAARLFINPGTLRSTLTSDYAVDAVGTDAYAITPTPAITAYTAGQVFVFKAGTANTGAATLAVSGLTAKGIKKNFNEDLETGDILAGQVLTVVYENVSDTFQMQSIPATVAYVSDLTGKFGGTGADGALTVSSGTTNIDLGSAAVVVKNYTTISITGTGAISFTNPHASGTLIYFKATGNVTLTSSATPMIDASGMGAAGGTGGVSGDGNNGTNAQVILDVSNHFGAFGLQANIGSASASGGAAGAIYTNAAIYTSSSIAFQRRTVNIACGSGGGGGGSGLTAACTGGTGGRGGGALIIECKGALNFTTAAGISVAGKVGTAGQNRESAGQQGAGGGGGGSAGMCIIMYNTLTAASGTVTCTGGAGGNGGSGGGLSSSNGRGASGAGGAGTVAGAGGAGGGSAQSANGTAGSAAATGGGGGGGGGGGSENSGNSTYAGGAGGAAGADAVATHSLIIQNTLFA